MTRVEFLDALRKRLNRLPSEELESALDYYNEIFLDAGEENEEQTAENLGSIDTIARQIYNENGIDPDGRPKYIVEPFGASEDPEMPEDEPVFGESVLERMQRKHREKQAARESGAEYQEQAPRGEYGPSVLEKARQGEFSTGRLILIICLFPLWLPLVIVAFVFAFVIGVVGFALEIALISAGFGIAVSGIVSMFSVPPLGFMSIGIGLILIGIFILTVKAVFAGSFKVFGAITNAIAAAFRTIIFGGAVNG